MPLSQPAPRVKRHNRTIELEGFERDDGLWDIEGHLVDVKGYAFHNAWRGEITAGTPVHEMWIRLTVDDTFTVRDVEAALDAGPHQPCPEITPAYRVLIGETNKPGWNQRVRKLLGGVRGCVHLVEMLGPVGTIAYQTIRPLLGRKTQARGADAAGTADTAGASHKPPARIDTCHAMRSDGPLVKERWPEFYTGKDSAAG